MSDSLTYVPGLHGSALFQFCPSHLICVTSEENPDGQVKSHISRSCFRQESDRLPLDNEAGQSSAKIINTIIKYAIPLTFPPITK